jgi:hypothetical protein
MWFNEGGQAMFFLGDGYVAGRLFPIDDEPVWSVSSRVPLPTATFDQIVTTVRHHDPDAQALVHMPSICTKVIRSEPDHSSQITADGEEFGDYIYDVDAVMAATGGDFGNLRRRLRRFSEASGNETTVEVITNVGDLDRDGASRLFDEWREAGTDGSADAGGEEQAFATFLGLADDNFGELVICQVRHAGRLVGLSVCELLGEGFATAHFHKADLRLANSSYFLFHTTNRLLQERGVRSLNFQEDAGIPGLRTFKQGMSPAHVEQLYSLSLS